MSPLPTTVTTAKATRTRRTAEETADSQPSNAVIPKPKPHQLLDIPDSEISQEILEYFHQLGMGRDEIKACASQWLVTQAEVRQWEAKLDAADQAERERIDRETAKAAAQMNACILQHGQVKTMAIRQATPEKLLDFIDYYEAELDDLYPRIHDEQAPDRAEVLDQWHRLNGFLWECKVQAGMTGPRPGPRRDQAQEGESVNLMRPRRPPRPHATGRCRPWQAS